MKETKPHTVRLSTIGFIKVTGLLLFSLLMRRGVCPSWFLAFLLSVNILQCMALVALKIPSCGVRASFSPLKIGNLNTTIQFCWIVAISGALASKDLQFNLWILEFGYLCLATLQVIVFFKYLFRFRLLLLRALTPRPHLPRIPETATQSG